MGHKWALLAPVQTHARPLETRLLWLTINPFRPLFQSFNSKNSMIENSTQQTSNTFAACGPHPVNSGDETKDQSLFLVIPRHSPLPMVASRPATAQSCWFVALGSSVLVQPYEMWTRIHKWIAQSYRSGNIWVQWQVVKHLCTSGDGVFMLFACGFKGPVGCASFWVQSLWLQLEPNVPQCWDADEVT